MTPADVIAGWRAQGLRVCEYRPPFANSRSASQWTSCPADVEPDRRRSFIVRGPADGAPTPSYCVHCGWPGRDVPDDHLHPVAYECKACRRAAHDAEHDPLTGAPVAQREATL